MKIAILGGSFDPPHKGHIIIANRLMNLYHFDQIWLMPLFTHPFNKNLSSPTMRLEMTKYLEKDPIRVSDMEIKQKTISYTINTLNFLSDKFPKAKFYWVIGTDQVESFTKWKDWKKIIDNFKLIVVPRTASKKAEKELKIIIKQINSPKNIISVDKKIFSPINISSTLIRRKIKEKKSIADFVPKGVEKYIMQNNLYK